MKLSGRGRIAAVGVACVAIGATFGPTFATAATSLKDVIVRNTAEEPVPTSAVGTTRVNVENTAPIPVTPVTAAGPTVTPVTTGFKLRYDGFAQAEYSYTVPDGKRLEIEFVTISGAMNGADLRSASVRTVHDGDTVTHSLAIVDAPGTGEAVSQPTKILAEPGSEVLFTAGLTEVLGSEHVIHVVPGSFVGTLTDA